MQYKLVKVATFTLLLGLLVGCSHNMAQIDGAKSTAEEALAKANDAYRLAQKSHNLASEAAYAAEQAQNTADSALECCSSNSSKLDRMFEKAMMK